MAEKRKKPKPSTAKPVAFRIPQSVLDRLDVVAANEFTSRNKLVTKILNDELPKRPTRNEDNHDNGKQLDLFS